MLIYILCWFPMLLIAVANGLLRELVIKKRTNDLAAHQLSTLTLIITFALYIGLVIKKFPPVSSMQALQVGMIWLLLTLAFEFGFGRWRGSTWQELLEDYNIANGRLWIFIPLWVFWAPYLFFKLYN